MSDYLPDQLLAHIFFKLAAKTVLDCRCVCKSWCSVISDSNFISDYNRLSVENKNNKNYTHIIVSRYDLQQSKDVFTLHQDDNELINEHQVLDMPFDHGLSRYMIVGLCCGLVCLLEISKAERLPLSLLIWNPSVGYSFKTFPLQAPVGRLERPLFGYGPSLRFSEGNVAFVSSFGFGFDPKSNDYKVVRIVYRVEKVPGYYKRVPEIVDVFALSTGEWKIITESAPSYVIKESSVHGCVNGAVHWIGYYNGNSEISISKLIVAVFDLSDEVFKQFELPGGLLNQSNEIGDDTKQLVSVGVINQSLALLHYHSHRFPHHYSFRRCWIWVMNKYGATESWTKTFDVQLVLDIGRILGVRRNGKILVGAVQEKVLLCVYANYLVYKPLSVRGEAWSFNADPYMECLIIYKKVNGVPMVSTSATSNSKQELSVETNQLKINDKGKEIVEEE